MPGLPIYHTWTCDWNRQAWQRTLKRSVLSCANFQEKEWRFRVDICFSWHSGIRKNVGKNVSFLETKVTRLLWWRAICVCVTLNAKGILLIITIQQLWTSRRRQNQTIVSFLWKFKVFWIFSLAKPHLLIFLKGAPTVG